MNCELLNKYFENYRSYCDLLYDVTSPNQRLDLWLPNIVNKPYPVVLFFHGGGFGRGSKQGHQSEPALRALEYGYAVADIDYRKSGEAIFPGMLMDAKKAVRYLRAHAKEYNLDHTRFAAWGASSGGWIASMLGASGNDLTFQDATDKYFLESDTIQAVVDWCGPCGNFYLMDSDFKESGMGERNHSQADSTESIFMGSRISDIPDLCVYASPIAHVGREMPPTLIIHGVLDPIVPIQQSRRFYKRIARLAGEARVEFHELDGIYHHCKEWNDNSEIFDITIRFLNNILM